MEIPKILEECTCVPPQHVGALMFLNGQILLLLKEKGDTHWALPCKDTSIPEPISMSTLGHVESLVMSLLDIDRERSPPDFKWLPLEPLYCTDGLFFFIDVGNAPEIELFGKYAAFTWLSTEELAEKKFPLAESTTSVLHNAWLLWAFHEAMGALAQHVRDV